MSTTDDIKSILRRLSALESRFQSYRTEGREAVEAHAAELADIQEQSLSLTLAVVDLQTVVPIDNPIELPAPVTVDPVPVTDPPIDTPTL